MRLGSVIFFVRKLSGLIDDFARNEDLANIVEHCSQSQLLNQQEATSISTADTYKKIRLTDGSELSCNALIVASGVSYRWLDAPGIKEFTGAGVYYGAAMTEAQSLGGKDVFVVGGANSAGQGAVHFSKFARTVTMLIRSGSLDESMSKYLIDRILTTDNIKVM